MTVRDDRINSLLQESNQIKLVDILKADFGEWPPNGLVIDVNTELKANIFPLRIDDSSGSRFRKLWRKLTGAGLAYGNTIWINLWNTGIFPGGRSATLGHEATHVLQSAHMKYYNEDRVRALIELDKKRHPSNLLSKIIRGIDRFIAFLSLRSNSWYKLGSEETEIQARIHSLMAEGYQKWQKLPTDKEEFWAALIATGIDAPKEIKTHLKNTSYGRKAFSAFSPIRRIFTFKPRSFDINIRSAYDINMMQRNFYNRETAFIFWQEHLPKLYGELIEMYGDKKTSKSFFSESANGQKNFIDNSYRRNYDNKTTEPRPHSVTNFSIIKNTQVIKHDKIPNSPITKLGPLRPNFKIGLNEEKPSQ